MDVLHREEVVALLDADVEDLRDVRVMELGREPRFVEEHVHELRVVDELRHDPLDDHELLEALDALGAREEQLRHPAHRDLADELVPAERGTGG